MIHNPKRRPVDQPPRESLTPIEANVSICYIPSPAIKDTIPLLKFSRMNPLCALTIHTNPSSIGLHARNLRSIRHMPNNIIPLQNQQPTRTNKIQQRSCRKPTQTQRDIPLYNTLPNHPGLSIPTRSTLSNPPINPPLSYYSFPKPYLHRVRQTHCIPSPGLPSVSAARRATLPPRTAEGS